MDIFREWDRLCEEHDAARDEYFDALSIVRRRFAAIQRQESTDTPTETELERLAVTRKTWDEVMQRMDDFIKRSS